MESAQKIKPLLQEVASGLPELPRASTRDIRPFFKSIQWSADGTTVIASSSKNTICSYVLPEDLLEARSRPLSLRAQGIINLPEPTQAIAPSPYYSLAHPQTQTILTACRDHPIQLYGSFPLSTPEGVSTSSLTSSTSSSPSPSPPPSHPHQPPLATYPWIKPETEAYLTASSLIWPAPGTHFVAGAANQVAYFDASRQGASSTPVLRIPTIPSARHRSKGSGVGMKGTVSALAAQPDSAAANTGGATTTGLIAAGTWTRWVGLYDLSRAGSCVATWRLPSQNTPRTVAGGGGGGTNDGGGGGIVQTIWSPSGRYLVLNERRSPVLQVYDVRVTGRLLAVLSGRGGAGTNQRLSCDVFPASSSTLSSSSTGDTEAFEVWAGTADGRLLLWDHVGGEGEGGGGASDTIMTTTTATTTTTTTTKGHGGDGELVPVAPSWEWAAHGPGSAVGAAALHPSGSVLATCSGSWEVVGIESDDDDDDDEDECSEGEDDAGEQGSSKGDGSEGAASMRGAGGETGGLRTTDDTRLKIWSITSGQP